MKESSFVIKECRSPLILSLYHPCYGEAFCYLSTTPMLDTQQIIDICNRLTGRDDVGTYIPSVPLYRLSHGWGVAVADLPYLRLDLSHRFNPSLVKAFDKFLIPAAAEAIKMGNKALGITPPIP